MSKKSYDETDGRAYRLAGFVLDHVVAQTDGMQESMTFWESRSAKHARYFEGRRHALMGVQNTIMQGIVSFFSADEVAAIMSRFDEEQRAKLQGTKDDATFVKTETTA